MPTLSSSKRLALLLQLLLAASAVCAKFIGPYKMTFASSDPVAAQAYSEKYLGGEFTPQPHKGGDGECALVKWVKFPGTDYEFHFVKGYHRPNGTMNLDEFAGKLANLHADLTRYDQYMGYRVVITVDTLDPIVSRLLLDGQPVLARRNLPNTQGSGDAQPSEDSFTEAFSAFVEIPNAIIVEIVSPVLTVMAAQDWDLCVSDSPSKTPAATPAVQSRKLMPTSEKGKAHQKVLVSDEVLRMHAAEPIPNISPVRAVYASPEPRKAFNFVATYFNGSAVTPITVPSQNLSCYEAYAMGFPDSGYDYQLWWEKTPLTPTIPGLRLTQFAQYLRNLHGWIQQPNDVYDEYMDYHVGLFVDLADPYVEKIRADNVPFFTRGQYGKGTDVFIEGPFGQIYEIVASKSTIFGPDEIENWDLCGPDRR